MLRVLCVDDDPGFLEMLKTLLKKRGYDVLLAGSGMEALSLLEETLPDVILLDIMMPGMDGWETLRRIRERGCRVPVIVLTVLYEPEYREKSLAAGADAVIPKPVERAILFKTIECLLNDA
ncbi:response regulator transcription factor [Candidatus Pyrohabitans sp.]